MKRSYPSKAACYTILIAAALVVLAASLTALMRGKDFLLYEQFSAGTSSPIHYGDYLALTVIAYFFSVLIPIAYALRVVLHTVRRGQSRLSRLLWGFLLLASLATHAANAAFDNLFFYVQLIGLIALFGVHVSNAFSSGAERKDQQ